MKYDCNGELVFSPSDLIRFSESPFSSWMDRYYLETRRVKPDEEDSARRLFAEAGNEHERRVLENLQEECGEIRRIETDGPEAFRQTDEALNSDAQMIYQAALRRDQFAGYADFLIRDEKGDWIPWDSKLALSTKPYFILQLACYAEMLAGLTGHGPSKIGVVLGDGRRQELRLDDFFHYYLEVKRAFLIMQDEFSDDISSRPEPLGNGDHGRWTSHAEEYFDDRDHLIRVAGITSGQIKKLRKANIETLESLANSIETTVPRMAADTHRKLATQASLQVQTRERRQQDPEAKPVVEKLADVGPAGESRGLALLPPASSGDVWFDIEGFPLAPGGLEYLFGCIVQDGDQKVFHDWWAHDRREEGESFKELIDWLHDRWSEDPSMHVYHYAPYEVTAIRRLSTSHGICEDKVDDLLRNQVFVDLYRIVRQGLCVGEENYSLKSIEHLYRDSRGTEVATAVESVVEYARWIASGESQDWQESDILRAIRVYNEDDCVSTMQLTDWLRKFANDKEVKYCPPSSLSSKEAKDEAKNEEKQAKQALVQCLLESGDEISETLASLVCFHDREAKPIWWQMFDRAEASPQEQRDDPGCIEGAEAIGEPGPVKSSLVQTYRFDADQELKIGDGNQVKFVHALGVDLSVHEIDGKEGIVRLKIGQKSLGHLPDGGFPQRGTLILNEYVRPGSIPGSILDTAQTWCNARGELPEAVHAILHRRAESAVDLKERGLTDLNVTKELARKMDGGILVLQGPPGTGKTYTASHVITDLLAAGKRVGISANSHKAIINLLEDCAKLQIKNGSVLEGTKVGGKEHDLAEAGLDDIRFVRSSGDAFGSYEGGVVAGTAWLFSRAEWRDQLDLLVIDEAGQMSLANAVAMARCARNVLLLGDQMQLSQPTRGSHPGDGGLSVLHYILKDTTASQPDAPVFHSTLPNELGVFLGESYRMHPDVCRFISEGIYEGRLGSKGECAQQRIELSGEGNAWVTKEAGIAFSPVEHDGNVQSSDEEVTRVVGVFDELCGRPYTARDGRTAPLTPEDFLFIAPYNAQVRALREALPQGARVGSVDKFQGQQAPVCVLSLCSSAGEYGARGLGFILDRNRLNVAISRAQCLAVVVADPRIAEAAAHTVEEMRLINLLCRIKQC